jgi:hypothetical protein
MGTDSIRVMPMRANQRDEYGESPSRLVCKNFPRLAAPAKIPLLPLQAVNVRAGEKKGDGVAGVEDTSKTCF